MAEGIQAVFSYHDGGAPLCIDPFRIYGHLIGNMYGAPEAVNDIRVAFDIAPPIGEY
jgi:hypothetical protein